jgi:hypothetical protein
MTAYGVILFYTTSSAMRAEKVLAREGYSMELIPTPRELSSDCGIALRFDWDRREQIEAAVNKAGIEISGIHRLETSS